MQVRLNRRQEWNVGLVGTGKEKMQVSTEKKTAGIPVRIVCDTSQSVVPRKERCQQRKESSCFNNWHVRHIHGVPVQIPDPEEHERQVEREEQGEECDGRSKRAEHQDEGKDEPAY